MASSGRGGENVTQTLGTGAQFRHALVLGQVLGRYIPRLHIALQFGQSIRAELFITSLYEVLHKLPLGTELDSVVVAIDGTDINDGPNPSHRASETECKNGNR